MWAMVFVIGAGGALFLWLSLGEERRRSQPEIALLLALMWYFSFILCLFQCHVY